MIVDGLQILSYNDGQIPPQLQCWWVYDNTTDTPDTCVTKTGDSNCSPQTQDGKFQPRSPKVVKRKAL